MNIERVIQEATGTTQLIPNSVPDEERLGLKHELFSSYSDSYEERTKEGIFLYKSELDLVSSLAIGKMIDLGCGPGRDAQYLKRKGHAILCCDFSKHMLRKCDQKGLETQLMNYETDFAKLFMPNSLGGFWTNCSLTTTPVAKIKILLSQIHAALLPRAPAFFGFIEGEQFNEGWITCDKKYALPRFRFRANHQYISTLLQNAGFHIIHAAKYAVPNKNTYLKYVCVKEVLNERL